MSEVKLYLGDCLEIMRGMEANSIDAIVTDPPYGLEFMGKDWDHGVPGVHFWEAALSVAKPGAHLLAFGGTRTHHRLMCAIEDAGWGIRDCVMWVYGSGFPKSHDISKAIDKMAGIEREIVGISENHRTLKYTNSMCGEPHTGDGAITLPATPDAQKWDGWGTALKPAWEPVIVARKPVNCTVAENVLKWGTGAINVDGSRVPTNGEIWSWGTQTDIRGGGYGNKRPSNGDVYAKNVKGNPQGRWPANFIHDGSEEVMELFPNVKTGGPAKSRPNTTRLFPIKPMPDDPLNYNGGDSGSAARFFYCAKASKSDRDEGLEGMGERIVLIGAAGHKINPKTNKPVVDIPRTNHHPTVKPTALMQYLCRLVTPPGGIILDPFMGSGSTGKAAILEGFNFVGIEIKSDYYAIAEKRIANAQMQRMADAQLQLGLEI